MCRRKLQRNVGDVTMSSEISGISLDTMQQMQKMMMYSSAVGGKGADFSSIFSTALMIQMMSEMQNKAQAESTGKTGSAKETGGSAEKAESADPGSAAVSDAEKLKDIFERASKKYAVSEQLLLAVAKAESNFDTTALSNAGAMGVMQLMPLTAEGLGVTDAYDPEQNIMAGAELLSGYLSDFSGDVDLTLAAYNAGPGNVKTYGGVPPFAETLNYIERVNRYLEEGVTIPGASGADPAETAGKSEADAGSESGSVSSGMDDMMKTMTKMLEYQLEYSMLNMQMNMLNAGNSGSGIL